MLLLLDMRMPDGTAQQPDIHQPEVLSPLHNYDGSSWTIMSKGKENQCAHIKLLMPCLQEQV